MIEPRIFEVTNIKWDTDGRKIKLPKFLTVIVPEDITDNEETLDFISDKISDITGYCHFSFNTIPEII